MAFVYELEELYNMIGSTAEWDKVLKLWYGLRTSIQQALWQDGFNPEISSWDEVVNGAEIIEISEGVSAPRNRHQTEVFTVPHVFPPESRGIREFRGNQIWQWGLPNWNFPFRGIPGKCSP
jgi:hypothetical protein